MASSPIYGWAEPDNTDLVKNGALAIRTLGNAIDTTMATMTPKSTYTAKGSLAAASAASTPANLTVGADGTLLTADSTASTGLSYQGNFAAGKNKIINGSFDNWARGTTFTPTDNLFFADRFSTTVGGTITTQTLTRETFTPGTAPVAGYEGQYFTRWAITTNGTSTYRGIRQKIENVQTFAGQTVTISFWAKSSTSSTLSSVQYSQNFGSGGSGSVDTSITMNSLSLGTGWARYTGTVAIPSVAGKTIGTSSSLGFIMYLPATGTVDTWGWQVEAGSVATAFQTATGTIQGELAACQRYYYRKNSELTGGAFGIGQVFSITQAAVQIPHPVTMRTTPTLARSGLSLTNATQTRNAVSAISNNGSNVNTFSADFTTTGIVAGNATTLVGSGTSTTDYIEASAEL